MTSYTLEVLSAGGFTTVAHEKMVGDLEIANDNDPGSWNDMVVTLNAVKKRTCRPDDWNAPLDRNHADLGEIKRRRGQRLYRLYVYASRTEPGQVILLHFGWKPPGRSGLETQNEQIDEAFNRLMSIGS